MYFLIYVQICAFVYFSGTPIRAIIEAKNLGSTDNDCFFACRSKKNYSISSRCSEKRFLGN